MNGRVGLYYTRWQPYITLELLKVQHGDHKFAIENFVGVESMYCDMVLQVRSKCCSCRMCWQALTILTPHHHLVNQTKDSIQWTWLHLQFNKVRLAILQVHAIACTSAEPHTHLWRCWTSGGVIGGGLGCNFVALHVTNKLSVCSAGWILSSRSCLGYQGCFVFQRGGNDDERHFLVCYLTVDSMQSSLFCKSWVAFVPLWLLEPRVYQKSTLGTCPFCIYGGMASQELFESTCTEYQLGWSIVSGLKKNVPQIRGCKLK